MANKVGMTLVSLVLISFGVHTILSSEIPAMNGKGLIPGVTSFPFTDPYVITFVGWIFVLAGGALFARALYLGRKK